MSTKSTKADIVKNAIRRFQHLPTQTIARHILNTHGDLFENDLEKIRDSVRYHLGKHGKQNLKELADKSLIRPDDMIIKMPTTWRKTRKPYHLPVGLWLVLSDLHVPFHEPMPLEQAIKYGQANKVDGVFINGDFQDCASVSYWPTARRDFNKEVELVIDMLDLLRQEFPKQMFVYKPGNHEYRLPRAYVSQLPDLAESPLAAMETIIGFEERNIEFLDYHQKVQAGLLPIFHGHEFRFLSRAVNTARGLFLKAKTFAACSHTHSTSEHTSTTVNDEYLTCWSFGCLCDLHPDYNPFGNDWNWGFALINVSEKEGDFEVENKRVLPSGDVR